MYISLAFIIVFAIVSIICDSLNTKGNQSPEEYMNQLRKKNRKNYY